MDELRTCPECGDAKLLEDFYRAGADGRMRVCKNCHKARVVRRQNTRYATDPDFRAAKVARVVRRQNTRYAEDARFAVNKSFSVVLRESLVGRKAGRRWEEVVGYSLDDLMAHLESQFWPGMSWDNFGTWHIDHIVPRSAFSFESTDDPEFRDCWALSNLQPLWAADNLHKSDTMKDGRRGRDR